MAVPTAERMPKGLGRRWSDEWRWALRVLKAQDTWKFEQRPLLDEYIFALIEAEQARAAAEANPYRTSVQGVEHPHPGFAIADRAAKRAAQLADVLLLTEASRRAHGLLDEHPDPGDAPKGDQDGL